MKARTVLTLTVFLMVIVTAVFVRAHWFNPSQRTQSTTSMTEQRGHTVPNPREAFGQSDKATYDKQMIELENRLIADPSISERERLRQVWDLHVELKLGSHLSPDRRRQVTVIHEEMLDARDRLDRDVAQGMISEQVYPTHLANIIRVTNARYAVVLTRDEFAVLLNIVPEDDLLPFLQRSVEYGELIQTSLP